MCPFHSCLEILTAAFPCLNDSTPRCRPLFPWVNSEQRAMKGTHGQKNGGGSEWTVGSSYWQLLIIWLHSLIWWQRKEKRSGHVPVVPSVLVCLQMITTRVAGLALTAGDSTDNRSFLQFAAQAACWLTISGSCEPAFTPIFADKTVSQRIRFVYGEGKGRYSPTVTSFSHLQSRLHLFRPLK